MLFNDVLYRIKTTDEIINPLRVFVSDKEFVKFFIKAMVGGEYNVPTYAVLESEAEVERYKFPPRCFIKATHGSAMMLIRREGEPVDTQPIKSWFRMNYYLKYREANYRHLKAKVFVEPHIFDNMNAPDYKFFCVNGTPRLAFVNVDSRFGKKRAFFDISWNRLNFGLGYPLPDTAIARPGNLQEMLEVAARLSSKFSFVRIDLYSDGSSCRVGEITNCHAHASSRFLPAVAEEEASRMLFH